MLQFIKASVSIKIINYNYSSARLSKVSSEGRNSAENESLKKSDWDRTEDSGIQGLGLVVALQPHLTFRNLELVAVVSHHASWKTWKSIKI